MESLHVPVLWGILQGGKYAKVCKWLWEVYYCSCLKVFCLASTGLCLAKQTFISPLCIPSKIHATSPLHSCLVFMKLTSLWGRTSFSNVSLLMMRHRPRTVLVIGYAWGNNIHKYFHKLRLIWIKGSISIFTLYCGGPLNSVACFTSTSIGVLSSTMSK